jgi:hypothetical protein
MPCPDLEALETLLMDRLLAIQNGGLLPEPAFRSVFNLIDESERADPTPRRLPGAGLLHNEEPWNDDEALGPSVSKTGKESWLIVILCDAPARGGGMRGPRGAYAISKLVIDDIEGWQILDGCPVTVNRRVRYAPPAEDGELAPIAGYVLEISFPVDQQED